MTDPGLFVIVTTIQEPTPQMRRLGALLAGTGSPMIIMGDSKGPARFDLEGAEFFSLAAQGAMPYALAPLLPTAHYCRKNLGYLEAIRRGAACIYETDDDNVPNGSWRFRNLQCPAQIVAPRPWFNAYRMFTDEAIWPRGFPLEYVRDEATFAHDGAAGVVEVEAPIQQGLADGAPDVDAVWRLMYDRPIQFRAGPSIALPANTWCPFNSQSTWWWPQAYPLLYLPGTCSSRVCDIWRSFVAQRCLWELGHRLVFHTAEVVQERNPHWLLRNFEDEVAGYLKNDLIVRCLERVELRPGGGNVADNLVRSYEALVQAGFIQEREMPMVRQWARALG